jgi:hypothetical protein
MYRRLFPELALPIQWFAYSRDNGPSDVELFLDGLPVARRGRVEARMRAWSELNSWTVKLPWLKQLQAPTRHTVYELKSHQERILFIRCGNDAVAICGFVKKDDWSAKDKKTLDAAMPAVDAAVAECSRRR